MDNIQEKHERAVGDCFISWYNLQYKTCFSFKSRADEAPDLIYSDGKNQLKLEIVDAYYDKRDAQMKWMSARKIPNAPNSWSGVDFDEKLVQEITKVLIKKSEKSYGSDCVLVVNVNPSLTTAEELESLIPDISVPNPHPFVSMFLTGHFPITSDSTGGFRCWCLSKPSQLD